MPSRQITRNGTTRSGTMPQKVMPPVNRYWRGSAAANVLRRNARTSAHESARSVRSEEHTSELQSHVNLVCRLLLEKKKKKKQKLKLHKRNKLSQAKLSNQIDSRQRQSFHPAFASAPAHSVLHISATRA